MKQSKDKLVTEKLTLSTHTLRRLSGAMTDEQLKEVVGGQKGVTHSQSDGCP